MESIEPKLKSFFRGRKTVVECGIEAPLKLITHDNSVNSCSLADLFDFISERDGITERIFLYQQRRFAKLGKAARSVLQALDILQKVVDEAENFNQLTEAC